MKSAIAILLLFSSTSGALIRNSNTPAQAQVKQMLSQTNSEQQKGHNCSSAILRANSGKNQDWASLV